MNKKCVRCGSTERYKNGDCAPCARERARNYHDSHPKTEEQKQRVRDNGKRWAENNRERATDRARRWRERNPERVKEILRDHYQRHSDRRTESTRNWYARNKERAIKTARNWQAENPEQVKAIKNNRRARQKSATGKYTAQEFEALCKKYDYKCLCCGRGDVPLTADHVIPLSRGGSGDIGNIQPLCHSCNSKKHAKTKDYRSKGGIGRWVQRKLFG